MLKYQTHIKFIALLSILLLFACAGNKKNIKPKPPRDLFSDPEIVAFMKGDEFNEIVPNRQNTKRIRPPWATTEFLPGEYGKDHIARRGYDKIGKRKWEDISDSLRNNLREKLGGDLRTHVEQETRDSVFFKSSNSREEKIRYIQSFFNYYQPTLFKCNLRRSL